MKRGITLTILSITIAIMVILMTTATIIGVSSVNSASYEEFKSKFSRVSTDVNSYYIEKGELPITGEVILKEELPEELQNELIVNQDTIDQLFIVDMEKLRTYGVKLGFGSSSDSDVFIITELSHNLYYLKGYKYKGKIYYTGY